MTSALFQWQIPSPRPSSNPTTASSPWVPHKPPLWSARLFTSDALHGRKPCKALTRSPSRRMVKLYALFHNAWYRLFISAACLVQLSLVAFEPPRFKGLESTTWTDLLVSSLL